MTSPKSLSTIALVLPADVRIVPGSKLPRELREQARVRPSEYALTRPHARTVARVVDRAGADLLRLFRKPRRMADAVVEYGRAFDQNPQRVLRGAFPLLVDCMGAGILVAADSPLASPIVPTLAPGDRFAALRVVRCLALASDTEVYEVTDTAGRRCCLKIARAGHEDVTAVALRREATTLARLGGTTSPRVVRDVVSGGRPHLVLSWVDGVAPAALAAELRTRADASAQRRLIRLAVAVAEAYADLHARRVTHGDVHPGNVIVTPGGRVTVVDFGLGGRTAPRSRGTGAQRGGVPAYFEPEAAAALAARTPPPPSSAVGEQYAVAAMIYQFFTGQSYVPLSLDQATLLAQIVNAPPRPFTDVGMPAWPSLERVLARALSKAPQARFSSMRAFARALAAVDLPVAPSLAGAGAMRFVERVLDRVGADGELFIRGFTRAPTSSVQLGASGVAFGLYRIACVRDDPGLLALAEAWNAKAVRGRGRGAYYNDAEGFSVAAIGRSSLYHSPVGTHLVGACLHHATGDVPAQVAAAHRSLTAMGSHGPHHDLALGHAGSLLACALLHVIGASDGYQSDPIAEFAQRAYRSIRRRLEVRPPIAEDRAHVNLGMAHGWAGELYAVLRWCAITNAAVPDAVVRRLDELAALGVRDGRGLRWPWRSEQAATERFMPGWCNGSAGFVHLWTLAHERTGVARYSELAERAGHDAWAAVPAAWDLCCGAAGRAYAMLAIHRRTGDRRWLTRAHQLAAQAVAGAMASPGANANLYPNSLVRGTIGVATLIEELARPDDARMPLFESEPLPVSAGGARR